MGKEKSSVNVIFLMRNSCELCQGELPGITHYFKNRIDLNFEIIDLDIHKNKNKKPNYSITPALLVNDNIWYAGKIDIDSFDRKINNLIN